MSSSLTSCVAHHSQPEDPKSSDANASVCNNATCLICSWEEICSLFPATRSMLTYCVKMQLPYTPLLAKMGNTDIDNARAGKISPYSTQVCCFINTESQSAREANPGYSSIPLMRLMIAGRKRYWKVAWGRQGAQQLLLKLQRVQLSQKLLMAARCWAPGLPSQQTCWQFPNCWPKLLPQTAGT